MLLNAGPLCGRSNDPPCLDGARRSVLCTSGEHEGGRWSVAAQSTNEARRLQGDANGARLIALAVDGDEHRAVGSVGEVFPPKRHDLRDAEASGVEKPDEDVLASFGEREHLGGVVFGEDAVGEGIARGGLAECGSDVERERTELRGEREKRFHGGEVTAAGASLAGERIREGLEVAERDRAERPPPDEGAEELHVFLICADCVLRAAVKPEGDELLIGRVGVSRRKGCDRRRGRDGGGGLAHGRPPVYCKITEFILQ